MSMSEEKKLKRMSGEAEVVRSDILHIQSRGWIFGKLNGSWKRSKNANEPTLVVFTLSSIAKLQLE